MNKKKITLSLYIEALTAVSIAMEKAMEKLEANPREENHVHVEAWYNVEIQELKRIYYPRLNRQGRRAFDSLQEASGVLINMRMMELLGIEELPPS